MAIRKRSQSTADVKSNDTQIINDNDDINYKYDDDKPLYEAILSEKLILKI
jgi:hypothetical protein